jgi:hypothetical protein
MTLFRNKNINKILILSISLFLSKWILSFYFFNENLSVKIIFENVGDGHYWYPYIKYLTSLDFNNSFDPNINNLKIVPIPVGSLIFYAIPFKIFGFAGIIIAEFFAIFIFLLIFYKIFSNFFNENESILLSLFFFMIPVLIKIINIESFSYLNTIDNNFFSLRTHRPVPANLYFFSFIYLLVSMDNDLVLKNRKVIYLALILGLSFSSFYYYFLIEFFSLLFFLIYKFKSKVIKELLNNYKNILFAILIFLITISPFIINLIYTESDSVKRAGLFALTSNKKSILINYYFGQYFSLKFLLILFLSIFCIYFSNKKNIINVRLLNIFFIILVSSIVSPIFFILISPKSGLLYHFNNAVVIWIFIFFIIFSIASIKYYLKLNLKLLLNNILIILLLNIYLLNFYIEKNKNFNDQVYKNRRIEFQKIAEKLNNKKKISLKNSALLTFDNELMIWSILNGIKYLNLVNGMFVAKTNAMIENDLINNFKFLNLNEKDFMNFLKNEKKGWRYFNSNVGNFFHYTYTANSLNTFKESKNFETDVKKFILSTSPMISQQIAIPNEEFNRLKIKFYENQSINFEKPEIILLEKLNPITRKIKIEKGNYCKLYDGNIYVLYLKKKHEINCEL